ncbi:Crp/Fnr family transcriptional regulator [Ferrimonas balearica]|uniref:Crp/Fnr family transcriptional regulator n=1 Tax=Ferrimonas balearica TaxID=44012 RepID=UPI001C99BF80|nr:hypothetical protein [Ferrimonas balearica]MBY5993274.1 hypothetical protein [Ferrimonas balearica]
MPVEPTARPALVAALRQLGVGESAAEALSRQAQSRRLDEGDSLCLSCAGMGLALVMRGTLLRQIHFHDGSIGGTELLFSGQFLFASGCGQGSDDNVRYLALEAGELLWVPMAWVYEICRIHKGFLEIYMERKHRYSRMVEDHLLLRSILSKKEHIVMTLAMIFSAKLRRNEYGIRITIEDLCTVTGATRQYYSKVIAELCQKKILENHYGSLQLCDYAGLKAELGEDARRHYDLFRAKPVAVAA